jgi:peptide/nickel transport system permease protein
MAREGVAGPRTPVVGAPAAGPRDVPARGYWEFVWRRLRRDRAALAGGVVVLLVLLAVFVGGPVLERVLGHGPNDIFPYAVDEGLSPAGPLSRVPDTTTSVRTDETTLFLLGADGTLGRDELLRLLYGGRVSLEIALGATGLALAIGVLLGSIAAFAGGLADALISRFTDFVMAFPVLLLLILIGSTVSDRIDTITLGGLLNQGVLSVVLLIGAFTWFYPARIVRSQVLSLRRRDFVEAARMTGAGTFWIVRRELLPHLVPPLAVYATLMIGANIILEASITFLGVGVRLPTASWGSLIASTWGTLLNPSPSVPEAARLLLTLWPSLAIFVTVLSFNLLGEGLRQAVDPRGASR